MVKPVVQTAVAAEPDVSETKSKILDSAFQRLAREGYAALSIREIARDAGVNHALINYHFGNKDQLVIAVLDQANRHLLERQQRMYAAPAGLAQKWAEARRFYETDLASGFVRVQAELWAASLADPALREKFIPRIRTWKKIVGNAVSDALAMLQAGGVTLPPPYDAGVIATWISHFWIGMEFADLLGDKREQRANRAALEAVERLLEAIDAKVKKASGRGRKK